MSTNDTKKIKHEMDDDDHDGDTCPPGMKSVDGKCVDASGEKWIKSKNEEDNAGSSSDKGVEPVLDADQTPQPADLHDCPPGSSWSEVDDACVPSGNAGDLGAGGTDGPTVSGKEDFYKMIEKLMASHSSYNTMMLDKTKSENQKWFDLLAEKVGVKGVSVESASFGKYKSSQISKNGNTSKAIFESTVVNPGKWFEASRKGVGGDGFLAWTISMEGFINSLEKKWINYGRTEPNQAVKGEAFTISGGDMPQIFSKIVYLIPGGRMRTQIRQYLDTQIIEDSDRYNWYKVGGFAFDDTTSEGSAPTEEAQTVTKVTATPALIRAFIKVNYADIENAPFDLIEAFNRAAGLGALDAEAKDVLDTVYDAITPTNWVEADGSIITEDDTTAPGTAKQEMIYAGKRLIENQGGDTSPGSLCPFLHPKAVEELVLDTAADFFTGTAGNALHSTALGLLENRLGVDMVVTNRVNAQNNTTNDTFRNILMMKGTIGLAVAADLQIEAQRRPDLSAVNVGARHRIKGAVIDETMTCRMSTTQ